MDISCTFKKNNPERRNTFNEFVIVWHCLSTKCTEKKCILAFDNVSLERTGESQEALWQ